MGDAIEVNPYLSFAPALNYLARDGTDVALALFCTDFLSDKESNILSRCEVECDRQGIPFFSLKRRGGDRVEISIFGTSLLLVGEMSDNNFWKKIAKIIIIGENPSYDNSRVCIVRNLLVSDTEAIASRWDELQKEMSSVFNIGRLIASQQTRKLFNLQL
jgi:hypothetical protein